MRLEKSVFISGGTGTLGQELVKQLPNHRAIIYSRDEYKQFVMRKTHPEGGEKGLRYFIGDIRDRERLSLALKGVDEVYHTAALKQIDTCEYNPTEAISTNVIGTQNVALACIENNVKKAIFISTDKAPAASTLYGATKLCAERLWIGFNNMGNTHFSAVRYGNVLGSRGSVIPKWKELAKQGRSLSVTHKDMTRFFWSIQEAASFIIDKMNIIQGGELFLPKMKAYKMIDIAKEISPKIKITGIRGFEKLHETLLCEEETGKCYEMKDCFLVLPQFHEWVNDLPEYHNAIRVSKDFKYTSEIGVRNGSK